MLRLQGHMYCEHSVQYRFGQVITPTACHRGQEPARRRCQRWIMHACYLAPKHRCTSMAMAQRTTLDGDVSSRPKPPACLPSGPAPAASAYLPKYRHVNVAMPLMLSRREVGGRLLNGAQEHLHV